MEESEKAGKDSVLTNFLQNVTIRSIIIGIICAFVIAIVGPFCEMYIQGTFLGADFLPIISVLFFVILVLVVNIIIRVINRNAGLSDSELIVIFIMMLVSAAIPTFGLTEYLLPEIAGFRYYASENNQWETLLKPHIASWAYVSDPDAARYFFEGLPKGQSIPWSAWIGPLTAWGIFILMLYFVMMCICVIFRKQWVEREKLVFPLIQLPMEMLKKEKPTNLVGDFFKNKIMWIGFLIPAVLSTWRELYKHGLMLVNIPDHWHVSFPAGGGAAGLPIWLNLPIVGFSYLVNLDVSFSLWFFHLFGMMQKILFLKFGFTIGSPDTYNEEMPATLAHEGMGAIIVLVLFGIWVARKHIKDVITKAFSKGEGIDDSSEMFSYRLAFIGLIAGIIGLVVWSSLAGMNFLVALLFIVLALFVFIAATRIMAEGGIVFVQSPHLPQVFTTNTIGATNMTNGDLAVLGFHFIWMSDIRAFIMPSFANSLKLADTMKIKSRQLFWGIIIAIIVSAVVSIVYTISTCYKVGGINLVSWFYANGGAPTICYDTMASIIKNRGGINWGGLLFDGIGAVFMGFLMYMRYRFLWWPIHPLGFPIANTFAMRRSWFAIFLAWLFKSFIIKYGGERLFRTLRPLFLGLILGEFITDGIWLLIDLLTGSTGHVLYNA